MSEPSKPGVIDIILSVLASAFGVQSHKNYSRDFASGSLLAYLAAGVIFVVLFITGLMLLVSFIISS